MSLGKRGGQNSQTRKFGAIMSESTTILENVSIGDVVGDSLDLVLSDNQRNLMANCTAQVTARKADGTLLVEVQETTDPFELNVLQWEINCSSTQERTTVDVNGDPIVVSYPPSLDWAQTGGMGMAWQYTTYADQTGEADVYIACEEITGSMYTVCRNKGLVSYIETLRTWRHKINLTAFFGHEKGNVLCLGVDVKQVAKRRNGDHLLQVTWKFMVRPGSPLSDVVANGGGWNTWHYWKDPNSGITPKDVWDEKANGAVKEIRHYEYKDFTTLYQYS